MAGSSFFHPLVLLVVLLAFGQFLEAADLSRSHAPQGPLGVRLDYNLATNGGRTKRDRNEGRHHWVFSTYLVFNEPVSSITDGQLRQIASDAYNEMADDIEQYGRLDRLPDGRLRSLPGVMTIMAFSNKIILASSQKGSTAFLSTHPNNPVSQTLDLCQTIWHDRVLAQNADDTAKANQDHTNSRKCGEISTFFQYYQEHDEKISDLDPQARVTTVNPGRSGMRIIPGCGTVIGSNPPRDRTDAWGCNLLVRHADVNVDYLLDTVEAEDYDLDEIAGGIKGIGQIQMHPCRGRGVIWVRGGDD